MYLLGCHSYEINQKCSPFQSKNNNVIFWLWCNICWWILLMDTFSAVITHITDSYSSFSFSIISFNSDTKLSFLVCTNHTEYLDISTDYLCSFRWYHPTNSTLSSILFICELVLPMANSSFHASLPFFHVLVSSSMWLVIHLNILFLWILGF